MTPKSLTDSIGFNFAPRNEMLGVCGSLFNISLVLRKWFSQHHWAMLRRSCSSFSRAASSSVMGKERNNFESSTYDSKLQELGAKSRSFLLH